MFLDDRIVLEDFTKILMKNALTIDAADTMPIGTEIGQQFRFDDVMMLGTSDFTILGRPTLKRASILATVEEVTRSDKVIVFKKKRRKGYQRSAGHKQPLTILRVDSIDLEMTEEEFVNSQSMRQLTK